LVSEPLAVLLLVHGVTVFANGRDGGGQVVDLDREVGRVAGWIARLKEVYLSVAEFQPRSGVSSAIRPVDGLKPEHISIERECFVGVLHNKCNVVQSHTSRIRHGLIMPVLVRDAHAQPATNGAHRQARGGRLWAKRPEERHPALLYASRSG
jgi:hypothetical protein